jgi:two-component system cell cycle sensor histidine kinase/response regulator CckA
VKFLVVEDDENSRLMLTALIEELGFTVVSACNGREALTMAKDSPPDMIISDIMMPEMDGFALCREVKRNPKLSHIPVIFCTATFTSDEDKKLAQSLGVSRYITKPLETESFIETITKIIEEYEKDALPISKVPKVPEKETEELYEQVLSTKLQKKVEDLEKEHNALRESESNLRLFKELINQSNDAIFVIDVKTARILDVNQKAWSNLGYSYDELLAMKVTDVEAVTPDESSWHKLMEEIDRQGTMFLEGAHKRKDGHSFPVEVSTRNIVIKDNKYNVAIARDITERKQAEKVIRQNEFMLSQSQRIAQLGTWKWDIKKNHFWWSDGAYRIREFKAQEISSTYESFRDMVHPDDREFFENSIKQALNKEMPYNIEYRIVLEDGSEKLISEIAEVELNDSGEPIQMIGTAQDITDRKKSENLLKTALKQALLSEKLAAIGGLAAGVSHEVLNPVNIISVLIQMLQKRGQDDPKTQETCSKVMHEIDRITKIMGTLLTFSRKGDSQKIKMNPKEIIEETVELVHHDFSSENIVIETSFHETSYSILADKDQMRQVFLNLVNNAKHAMPNGGTLCIKCERHKKNESDYARIKVSDTGSGIKKEHLEKIFDPFFTTKPEGKGTGLGLSIVHEIIKDHEGTIAVESQEEKGTTFIIDIPVAE